MIDVGRPVSRNLAVELVQAEQTDLREGKPVRVVARVFNAGLFPARDVPVTLALEGMNPLEQKITVEGRTRRNVAVQRTARQASPRLRFRPRQRWRRASV